MTVLIQSFMFPLIIRLLGIIQQYHRALIRPFLLELVILYKIITLLVFLIREQQQQLLIKYVLDQPLILLVHLVLLLNQYLHLHIIYLLLLMEHLTKFFLKKFKS
jgi:hypothetical protein